MRLLALAIFLIAFATASSAQTIVFKQSQHAAAPSGTPQVRVSIGVHLFIPAPNDDSEQTLKAQENGRRLVYKLAEHECDVLRDVLASECRLDSLNLNVQHLPRRPYGQQTVEGFTMTGNMAFRVTPK